MPTADTITADSTSGRTRRHHRRKQVQHCLRRLQLGAGAKYKLSKRNVIQFDYSGNNYASRYKYLIENSGYLPGQYALTKLQKFHDAELKGIFGFTTNSTTVFGADYRCEVLRRPDPIWTKVSIRHQPTASMK